MFGNISSSYLEVLVDLRFLALRAFHRDCCKIFKTKIYILYYRIFIYLIQFSCSTHPLGPSDPGEPTSPFSPLKPSTKSHQLISFFKLNIQFLPGIPSFPSRPGSPGGPRITIGTVSSYSSSLTPGICYVNRHIG